MGDRLGQTVMLVGAAADPAARVSQSVLLVGLGMAPAGRLGLAGLLVGRTVTALAMQLGQAVMLVGVARAGAVRAGLAGLLVGRSRLANRRYRVYRNDRLGGDLDERTPVAEVEGTTWTDTIPMPTPGDATFLVATYEPETGLETHDRSATVRVKVDAAALDMTGRPRAPRMLAARAAGAGTIQLTWVAPPGGPRPLGFHLYENVGTVVNFTLAPILTVLAGQAQVAAKGYYAANVPGLTAGTVYAFGVRAYNGAGEEDNAAQVTRAPTAAPGGVDALTIT